MEHFRRNMGSLGKLMPKILTVSILKLYSFSVIISQIFASICVSFNASTTTRTHRNWNLSFHTLHLHAWMFLHRGQHQGTRAAEHPCSYTGVCFQGAVHHRHDGDQLRCDLAHNSRCGEGLKLFTS